MGSTRRRQRIYSGRPCFQGKPVVSTFLVLTVLSSSMPCFLRPRRTESPPSTLAIGAVRGSALTSTSTSTSTLPRLRVHGRAGQVERSSGLHCRFWTRRKRILFTSPQRILMSLPQPFEDYSQHHPFLTLTFSLGAGFHVSSVRTPMPLYPSVRIQISQCYRNPPHFPRTNDRFAVRTDEPRLRIYGNSTTLTITFPSLQILDSGSRT